MCKFPDSDLNELINIVDSTKHNQTLLIHSKKNRDHLFWICAIFLTTAVDMMIMMLISDHEDDLTCSLSQLFHHHLARLLLKRIMKSF